MSSMTESEQSDESTERRQPPAIVPTDVPNKVEEEYAT